MSERDFNQIMDDIQTNEADKIDKIGELADNSSPEEVEALKELFEEGETESSSDTEKPDNADDKTKSEPEKKVDEPADKSKVDDKVIEPEKKEEPEKVVPLDTKPITINDEYISKADEKDRAILQTLKGETLSPKAIKMQVDAQREIGRLGTKIGELSKEKTDKPDKEIIPEKIPQQQFTEEVKKLQETEILNRMRKHFPDLPEDPTEAEEYINALPQRRFYQYTKLEDETRNVVENDFNRAIYVQENQREINKNILTEDINKIVAELKEDGIENPKQFGLDLTILKDADGMSKNALLQELITLDGKKLDTSLVTFIGNVPIFNRDALYNKFFAVKRGLIRDIIRKKTKIDSRKEAFNELKNHEENANHTASTEQTSGTGKYKGKEDFDSLSPKEVEELKKEMEK